MDTNILRDLIRFIKDLYTKIPPERIDGDLVVIAGPVVPERLDRERALTPRDGPVERIINGPAVIHYTGDGGVLLWNGEQLTFPELSIPGLLAYRLGDPETFWANTNQIIVKNASANSKSAFAIPTFWSLDEALKNYHLDKVRRSPHCELGYCWHTPECLRWKAGPEHMLRDSLYEYLNITLRAVSEVKREQIVDATHPVDLKVTWNHALARGLIEIKWLGKSFDDDGRMTSNYSEARAVDGARQLRNYVTVSEEENYELHIVGYLVVFDGRRRGIADAVSQISREHALHYKEREIQFTEELLNDKRLRLDYRFFVEPHTA